METKQRTVNAKLNDNRSLPVCIATALLADSGLDYRKTAGGAITVEKAAATTQKAATANKTETLPTITVTGQAEVGGESPSLTVPSIAESQIKLNRVAGGTSVIDAEKIYEGAPLTVNDVFVNAPGIYVADSRHPCCYAAHCRARRET